MKKVKTVKKINNGQTTITKVQPVKLIPKSKILPSLVPQSSENQMTMLEVTNFLNYHSIHSSLEQSKNWVIDFASAIKMPNISEIKKIDETFLGSLGIVCHLRMTSDKSLPDKYSDKYLEELIQKKCQEHKDRVEGNKKDPGLTPILPKTTINKALAKANELLSIIDNAFDMFLGSTNPIILPESVKSASKEELDILAGWCLDSWKLELECLIDIKTSDEMNEAYSQLSLKQVNSLKKFYSELINLVINATPAKKIEKVKKERVSKPKIIPLDKLLSQFVFLPSYETIQSFNVKDLFKSSELYLVDTKYSKIIKVVAEENKTFSVKGKTILNIDEANSGMKRVPKKNLDITISALNKGNKSVCAKIFEGLKNDVIRFGGRVNEEVLLLKQFF